MTKKKLAKVRKKKARFARREHDREHEVRDLNRRQAPPAPPKEQTP